MGSLGFVWWIFVQCCTYGGGDVEDLFGWLVCRLVCVVYGWVVFIVFPGIVDHDIVMLYFVLGVFWYLDIVSVIVYDLVVLGFFLVVCGWFFIHEMGFFGLVPFGARMFILVFIFLTGGGICCVRSGAGFVHILILVVLRWCHVCCCTGHWCKQWRRYMGFGTSSGLVCILRLSEWFEWMLL